jgi:hypothetical protein
MVFGCGRRATFCAPNRTAGVLTAGSCTIVTRIALPSCRISLRNASVKPRMANFAQ